MEEKKKQGLWVAGAQSIAFLRSKSGPVQTVLILGEEHRDGSKDCLSSLPSHMYVPLWILSLLSQYQDCFFDVFLEIWFWSLVKRLRGSQDQLLSEDLQRRFDSPQITTLLKLTIECFIPSKKEECLVDNAQFHAIDPRPIRDPILHLLEDLSEAKLWVQTKYLKQSLLQTLTDTTDLKKRCVPSVDPIRQDLKQIDPRFASFRQTLKEQYTSLLKNVCSLYKEIAEFAQEPDVSFGKSKQKVSRLLSEYMDTVDSQVDVFFLARFFHHWERKKHQRKTKSNKRPSAIVQNGLFYGGDWHARNIREWLINHNFEQVWYVRSDEETLCLYLSPGHLEALKRDLVRA